MTVDRDEFLDAAVQTPSHEGVDEMRTLLVDALDAEGYDPAVDEVGADGASVVVVARDPTGAVDAADATPAPDVDGTHLVLNTHIDTVAPHVPYESDGDVVRGRGACDAKGPLTALLDAFCTARVREGRLTLAVSPDEETSQFGGAHLAETLAADACIVGEPTGLDVCHAARGAFGARVTLRGEHAHASEPAAGTNAIRGVGPLVAALDRYDERRGPGTHPVLGDPTLTPTHVEGGGPLNQVPAACTVSVDRRSVPPETVEGFLADLRSYLIDELPDAYGVEVTAAYPESPDPEAFATDVDAPLVRTLAEASGGGVRPFGAATEASYFAAGAPTVVFGPGVLADEAGPVAHADREYVRRPDVAAAADAVRETVGTLLG